MELLKLNRGEEHQKSYMQGLYGKVEPCSTPDTEMVK